MAFRVYSITDFKEGRSYLPVHQDMAWATGRNTVSQTNHWQTSHAGCGSRHHWSSTSGLYHPSQIFSRLSWTIGIRMATWTAMNSGRCERVRICVRSHINTLTSPITVSHHNYFSRRLMWVNNIHEIFCLCCFCGKVPILFYVRCWSEAFIKTSRKIQGLGPTQIHLN